AQRDDYSRHAFPPANSTSEHTRSPFGVLCMRFLMPIWVTVTIAILASRSSAEPPKSPAPGPAKLYTDEEIRKLAKHDIDKVTGKDEALLKTPYLDVVPAGESYPRAKVFKALNIDETRIRDFRHSEVDFVVFLYWQVSPSYDICCMTATNDRGND